LRLQLRTYPRDGGRERCTRDEQTRRHDIDRVQQRIARKITVDECDPSADAGQAEPCGDILGTIRGEQRDGICAREAS
jgi:hypothetical protein